MCAGISALLFFGRLLILDKNKDIINMIEFVMSERRLDNSQAGGPSVNVDSLGGSDIFCAGVNQFPICIRANINVDAFYVSCCNQPNPTNEERSDHLEIVGSSCPVWRIALFERSVCTIRDTAIEGFIELAYLGGNIDR